jgi:hypothetical protein
LFWGVRKLFVPLSPQAKEEVQYFCSGEGLLLTRNKDCDNDGVPDYECRTDETHAKFVNGTDP